MFVFPIWFLEKTSLKILTTDTSFCHLCVWVCGEQSVAYDRSSAPKDCRVSGWLQRQDMTDAAVDGEKMFLLTEFTYDLEKTSAQTFNVLESAASSVVDTIRLDFGSNHGNPLHTCIYRLRVHGSEPNSVSMMPMES